MSYPINYPTPQGANVQIFQGSSDLNTSSTIQTRQSWVKPQGASFVWFTLIGPGGGGNNSNSGGGSGAVTNFMCPAFLIPDTLVVDCGRAGQRNGFAGASAKIIYQQKNGTGYTLLEAGVGGTPSAGSNMSANYFTAMGFFQSVGGQAGSTTNITASATTFLSGGTGGTTVTSNYGYSIGSTGTSFFQMSPIIVGVGGNQSVSGDTTYAGVGCGGGSLQSGGPGAVVIITW